MTETTNEQAGATAEPAQTKEHRPGWFERRRQRRRRRILFEEIMGWLLVPFILYFLYLGYVAIGGLPPAAKEVLRDLSSGLMR